VQQFDESVLLEDLSSSFASNTCGGENTDTHGNTSIPIALSNGDLNNTGVSFWYGARFSTEIYTRGCHWIPRLFA
jgi:hypothetical protein